MDASITVMRGRGAVMKRRTTRFGVAIVLVLGAGTLVVSSSGA
jgi:hypothetical protein